MNRAKSFIFRLMAYPLLRLMIAGLLAVIITLLLFILMRFLITGFDNSAAGVFHKLFTLETVVLPSEPQRPERVQRPVYIEQLPQEPLISDEEIEEEAVEFIPDQFIEAPTLMKPSAQEALRKKREELISILEEGKEEENK